MSRNLKSVLKRLPLLVSAVDAARSAKDRLTWRAKGPAIIVNEYQKKHGRLPDLVSPKLFSEKLCHRMVHIHKVESDAYTPFVDKVRAREFVAQRIGSEHLTQLFWTGTDGRDLPFASLPPRAMLKNNRGSGGMISWRQGMSKDDAIRAMDDWMRYNFYWSTREYQYKNIKPLILAEEHLDDGMPDGPLDYRFWCFNGNVAMIQVDNHLHSFNAYYSEDWTPLDVTSRPNSGRMDYPAPQQLGAMLQMVKRLSDGFDFVRVDIYSVGGRLLFGELTFTPGCGRFAFRPTEWDERLGAIWGKPTPGVVPDFYSH